MNLSRQRRRLVTGSLIGLITGLAWVSLEERHPPVLGPSQLQAPEVHALADLPADTLKRYQLPFVAPTLPKEDAERSEAPLGATSEQEAPTWAIPAAELDVKQAQIREGVLAQTLQDGTLIHYTLSPILQAASQRSLERYAVEWGAVVAIRPSTGEILAMAEYAHNRADLSRLALSASAPAASIFKLISGAAFLQHSEVKGNTEVCVSGDQNKLTLNHLKANAKRDRKCETLAQAMGSSNNIAFARWADTSIKPAQLQETADRFLFNRRLPFLWPVSVSQARIPTGSRLSYVKTAAGFESSTLSPLHAALITAAIGNEGKMMAPLLVKRAEFQGETLYEAEPQVLAEPLTSEHAKDLRDMMEHTITYGTGKKFFETKGRPRLGAIRVGGKSGSLSGKHETQNRHFSWFVALGPLEKPDIAVAALVIHGETWTVRGAVIAREVLEAFFNIEDERKRDPLRPR